MRSGADAVILDLEDSVGQDAKAAARENIREFVRSTSYPTPLFVRINCVDGTPVQADLEVVGGLPIHGIVLPKANGADSVRAVNLRIARTAPIRILPISAETPQLIPGIGAWVEVAASLCGVTWGVEDLASSLGVETAREQDGRLTPLFDSVRSQVLLSAAAAGIAAFETVFADIENTSGVALHARLAYRDGFVGMLAIHPSQVPAINDAFTPTPAEIARARSIVDLFNANPGAGCLRLDGQMIDTPHLARARRILADR